MSKSNKTKAKAAAKPADAEVVSATKPDKAAGKAKGKGKGNGIEPLVAGGRYDGLLSQLGAATPIPAVGFSIWVEALTPPDTAQARLRGRAS